MDCITGQEHLTTIERSSPFALFQTEVYSSCDPNGKVVEYKSVNTNTNTVDLLAIGTIIVVLLGGYILEKMGKI